tara:strand:- start:2409 stop:2876 length:468 start_codon:yes stop_codon:yes gene_type:complete
MASVQGRAAGFIATLYYVATVDATKDITSMGTGTASNLEIIDVADIGSLNKTRSVIDIPVYGDDTKGKLAGQADPGSFDFNVTLNMDDSIHTGLRDDDGLTPHTFIIKFTQGAAITYAAFDGYVADATVNSPIDDRIQMDVSVARSGGITWTDAA